MSLMRAHAPKTAKFLEIGPSFSPVAAKRDGYNVYTVDKATRADLIANFYGPDRSALAKIEEVDFVWTSHDLLDDVSAEHRNSFDVVIASHVLEHIPNPVRFLRTLQRLLKPGGYVTLALPDKRYCFDYFRPLTTTGAWLEAYDRDDHVHSRRTLFEYFSTVAAQNLAISWNRQKLEVEATTFSGRALSDAFEDFEASKGREDKSYRDCHAWVLTPMTVSLLINELHALGLIGLVPVFVSATRNTEFFVHLRYAERRAIDVHERMQLHAYVAQEQAAGFRGVAPARRRWLQPYLRRVRASRAQ